MKKSLCLCVLLGAGLLANAQTKMKPEDTEVWKPEPKVVTPGKGMQAPSDAIVLFDGSNLSEWEPEKGKKITWKHEGDALTVVKGAGVIRSKRSFGDMQLHIEWRSPKKVVGTGQGRGNSGVFLQGIYEVQVLDSYQNKTYSNGQAASVYKQHIPLANACLPPGEWQTYDIIYKAPRFKKDGSLVSPAYVTVIHNGILVQNHVEIKGATEYIGHPEYKAHGKGSLVLQDHGNPVSFRNIWVRELD
ncbi:DUF1080 domain-containing protein [Rapidithrix thailandica]|uniref:DUF1080 domain-containing protein n=1 Tax=Rapidithrix thailandica TaxID=413964 RepID=A0AAW9SCY1_9BACT